MSVNKNRLKAEQYFVSIGLMPPRKERTEKWVLHHIDPSLKTRDPIRYNEWRIEDLVPMTNSAHITLHNSIREITDETKHNMSINHADVSGDKNPAKRPEVREKIKQKATGRKFSEETKRKLSEIASDGRRASTNNPRAKKCMCVETGIVYNTLKEARDALGIGTRIIAACKTGSTAGGYHWVYVD